MLTFLLDEHRALAELSGTNEFLREYTEFIEYGYVFEDGSFHTEFIDDTGTSYSVSRNVKGTMPYSKIAFWNPKEIEEFDYTSTSGVPVHIIISVEEGIADLISDTDISFLFCRIYSENLTKDSVKAFADSLDLNAMDAGEPCLNVRSNEKTESFYKSNASMSDWVNSDEYKASAQWTEAFSSWFSAHKTITEEEWAEAEEKDYFKYLPRYELYCAELEKTLLDIAKQYGSVICDSATPVDFAVYMMPDADVKSSMTAQYEDGAVMLDMKFRGDGFRINYIPFQSFEELRTVWDDSMEYDEWSYTAGCGESVTIVMCTNANICNHIEIREWSPHNIIIYRTYKGWVVVDIFINNATASDLEAVADTIDFTKFA